MIYNYPDRSVSNIPVGKYAAESVAEIERLTAELAAAEEWIAAYKEMNALLLKVWEDAPSFPLSDLNAHQSEKLEDVICTTLKNLGMAQSLAAMTDKET